MDAQQWLQDLTGKANENINGEYSLNIKRLIAIVRKLAERAADSKCPNGWQCAEGSHDCSICHIQHAYKHTTPEISRQDARIIARILIVKQKELTGSVTCPMCKNGILHYKKASNKDCGHIHAMCETNGCLYWME